MKKMLKFQLKDLLSGFFIYALIMFALTIGFISVAITHKDMNVTLHGIGFTSAIFCLAAGIGIYKEHCQMAVQNSISRKDFFKSNVCITVIISLMCAMMNLALEIINQLPEMNPEFTHSFNYLQILQPLYPEFCKTSSAAMTTAASFLLEFLVNVILFITGALIAAIYCRLPRKFRTAYCIALPVFGCGASPVLFATAYFCPKLLNRLTDVFLGMMGITSGNPFLGVLTFTAASIIIACICYQVLRRTEIS